ncbi:MAG TPA: ATP-binding protein [Methylovirgula sp.]
MGDQLLAEIDNDIAAIAGLTARIEEFGEEHKLPSEAIFQLTLAFDELLTNIISYGFSDGKRHTITARIELHGDTIAAEIIDDGTAFDPLARATPDTTKSIEEREIGGLGIHFIRTVMDKIEYCRIDGHNHLKMLKKVRQAPVS